MLGIINFLLLVGAVVLLVLYFALSNDEGKREPLYLIGGLVLIPIVLLISGLYQVPAGKVAVLLRFGATTGSITGQGLHCKMPIAESVALMSIKTQLYEATAQSASRDLQDVETKIGLNFRLNPEKADIVYRELGIGYIDTIAAPAVQEVVKAVTAQFNAEDMILKRSDVKAAIDKSLEARLRDRGIIVETVNITNFEFSAEFTKAIEAKVSAAQSVLQSQNKLEQTKVEAQQAQEKAVGEANAAIAAARGQAQAIQIVTDAQVAANEKISSSLNPQILQYIFLDRMGKDIKVWVVPQGTSLVLDGLQNENTITIPQELPKSIAPTTPPPVTEIPVK